MKLTVHVTEDDIKQGVRKNCERCPVALAITRVGHYTFVGVGNRTVSAYDWHGSEYTGRLPDTASNFVEAFDDPLSAEYRVIPFTFELELT